MRDAAYETQVLDVRRQTHADVAEALAAHGAEPALIAQHLDLAGAGGAGRRPRTSSPAQAEQGGERTPRRPGCSRGRSSCWRRCPSRTSATWRAHRPHAARR